MHKYDRACEFAIVELKLGSNSEGVYFGQNTSEKTALIRGFLFIPMLFEKLTRLPSEIIVHFTAMHYLCL